MKNRSAVIFPGPPAVACARGRRRVQAGEDHGLDFFKSGQSFEGGVGVMGDGVANFRVSNILDVGNDEADFRQPRVDRSRRAWG